MPRIFRNGPDSKSSIGTGQRRNNSFRCKANMPAACSPYYHPNLTPSRPPAPRRSKLYIACSDFFAKVRARSCRCSSFPNRTRSAGLRFGFLLESRIMTTVPHRSKIHFASVFSLPFAQNRVDFTVPQPQKPHMIPYRQVDSHPFVCYSDFGY